MPFPIRLDFAPPPQDDVVGLRIFEAADEAGPWTEIEFTTSVGVFPTYLSHYTTENAVSATGWFSYAWEYEGDITGPLAVGVQAGQTPSLLARIVERVMQRDRMLDESVVAQEAEGVVEGYFGTDPYDPTLTASYRELNGLVLMTLYRSQLVTMFQSASASGGATESFTIGLVSAKSGTSTATIAASEAALSKLLELAYRELGVPLSLILQLAVPCDSNLVASYDHSRLLGWVGVE